MGGPAARVPRSALVVPADADPGYSPSRGARDPRREDPDVWRTDRGDEPHRHRGGFGLEPIEDAPQRAALAATAVTRPRSEPAAARGRASASTRPSPCEGCSSDHPAAGAQVDLDGKREAWTVLDTLLRARRAGGDPGRGGRGSLPRPPVRPRRRRRERLARARAPAARDRTAGLRTRPATRRRSWAGRASSGFSGAAWRTPLEATARSSGYSAKPASGSRAWSTSFVNSCSASPTAESRILEGRCQSYASAIPYFPILDILRANFRIGESDRA